MSYGVSFTREAELDLDRLKDPLLKSHVLDQLDLLARAPAKLSRPASFPHLPFQKYQFWSPDHAIHFTAVPVFAGRADADHPRDRRRSLFHPLRRYPRRRPFAFRRQRPNLGRA